jgi:nucleoside-diphosphate-sugar epimerase
MKILITGGAGYLGSVLTERLLSIGHEVTVLDKLIFNQISLLPQVTNPKFNFVYGDVRNVKLLEKLCDENEVIIPLAALVGFPACSSDPISAWDINYTQIENIVEFTKNKGKKILFPNTNSGYGVASDSSECTEDSPLNPISVYGESKCAAENLLMENTDAICFRLATVFGPSSRMRTDLLVNEFVFKAMTDKYIVVFERHFKRNFIHVNDVASVFIHSLDNYDTMKKNIYNVGLSDANLNKQELLEIIKTHIPNFAISYSDYYEDPDKRDYVVSNKKIESTGWSPSNSLDRGICELIKTYQILLPKMISEFRNGFPLGYANNT